MARVKTTRIRNSTKKRSKGGQSNVQNEHTFKKVRYPDIKRIIKDASKRFQDELKKTVCECTNIEGLYK
jgi:hypothetical protein